MCSQPRGATGQLPRLTDCHALKIYALFVICESAFSIMKRLKSNTRNRTPDETGMPACVFWLRKLKRTLTLYPKARNKNVFVISLVCCVSVSSRISLFWVANRQTENLKIALEQKIALGVQQKLGLLGQQANLLIAMEFLSLRPENFASSRNRGPSWSQS